MVASSQPRALCLVHEPDGGPAEVGVRLAERGFEVVEHLVTADMDQPDMAAPFPVDDEDPDLLVVLGSVRSLTRKQEISSWIHDEIDLVGRHHRAGTPILGICFGGQVLAEALGGTVEAAPVPEIGWYEISGVDGSANPAGPGPWLQWHHDRFEPPPGAELLAVSPLANQLFRVGTSLGTQFHPEVTATHIETWLGMAPDEYLAEHGVDRAAMGADAARHSADNVVRCHRLVDWFVDEVAGLDLSSTRPLARG